MDDRTIGVLLVFLGTFAVAALMFFVYVTALGVLLILAGISSLLARIFTTTADDPVYQTRGARRAIAAQQVGRHYRSAGAKTKGIR